MAQQPDKKLAETYINRLCSRESILELARHIKDWEESVERERARIEDEEMRIASAKRDLKFYKEEYERRNPQPKTPG
jgi:multidrug resistance efflux pump